MLALLSVTFRLFEQPRKTLLPIEVTLSGMVMPARLEQLRKASTPIEVTLSGMVMLVRPVH